MWFVINDCIPAIERSVMPGLVYPSADVACPIAGVQLASRQPCNESVSAKDHLEERCRAPPSELQPGRIDPPRRFARVQTQFTLSGDGRHAVGDRRLIGVRRVDLLRLSSSPRLSDIALHPNGVLRGIVELKFRLQEVAVFVRG